MQEILNETLWHVNIRERQVRMVPRGHDGWNETPSMRRGEPRSQDGLATRYSNPQSVNGESPARNLPRRAGQGRLYKQYVPAQGDEPPQLRHQLGEWQQDDPVEPARDEVEPADRRQTVIIVILGIMAIICIAIGGAMILRGALHPEAAAGTGTQVERATESFDSSADDAIGFLTAQRRPTDQDMTTLTMLFPSMTHDYELLEQQGDESAMSPDDVISQVSVHGWERPIPGWETLQLEVRAGEYALSLLESQHNEGYELTSAQTYMSPDGNPESVMLVCKCVNGKNIGLTTDVTVGLTGRTPQVVTNIDAMLSRKAGVLERLNAVIGMREGLYVADFALEGYTTPFVKEDGTNMRTETWWLYVNSNVAPTDINEFVTFVNDMLAAFQATASSDVVNIDLTVISCDATDPALGGRTFSELATELAVTSDYGGFYMTLDYPLRGQATTTTPCRPEDLDGRLHPWEWDSPIG